MTKTRRSFTDEFKREAVKLVKQPGAKVSQIARDLGIEQSVLRRWVDQQRGGALDMRPSQRSQDDSRLTRLIRVGFELSDPHACGTTCVPSARHAARTVSAG